MSLRKYQAVEKVEVSQEENRRINEGLRKAGKSSVQEMSEDEKRELLDSDSVTEQ